MIKIADYPTENALPTEMKTPERIALSYSFDRQKKKYFDRVHHVYIWADLESIPDDKLDFLAVENRVLFYDHSFAPEIKRSLIKNAIYWHMRMGTSRIADEVIMTCYPNDETCLVEWYKYNGDPYHFRIETTAVLEDDCYSELKRLLFKVKNARSRFDQIRTMRHIHSTFYTSAGMALKYKNPPVKGGMKIARLIDENISIATNINTVEQESVR